jgi:hypothetical protein
MRRHGRRPTPATRLQALGSSLYFMDSQRVGTLPPDFRVTWRKSERAAQPCPPSTQPAPLLSRPLTSCASRRRPAAGAFTKEASTSIFLATNPNSSLLLGPGFGNDFFGGSDPFAAFSGSSPFAGRRLFQDADPFAVGGGGGGGGGSSSDAFAAAVAGSGGSSSSSSDPFASSSPAAAAEGGAGDDPFAAASVAAAPPSPGGTLRPSPLPSPSPAPGSSPGGTLRPSPSPSPSPAPGSKATAPDPFAAANPGTYDPFATGSDPFAPAPGGKKGAADPFDPFAGGGSGGLGNGSAPEPAAGGPWDLSGGWLSGMAGGNIKATSPIAFTTSLLAWGFMAFPGGFAAAKQRDALRDSVRWGADYLAKVHRPNEGANTSLLVTRVGDVDTELLLWYRPEEGAARDAYAVELSAEPTAAGGDLGGSVAAGLAAAASLFQAGGAPGDAEYAAALLARAQEVYAAAKPVKARFTDADYNMTLLYNSSTVYDDLAWAAGWLYKATKQEAYLGDVYDFYVKHLEAEAAAADWKYAFDWDNVFWPLNVLLAQETGKGTFKKQSEQFLRSWMCANNAVNYTQRGRAFNPMSGARRRLPPPPSPQRARLLPRLPPCSTAAPSCFQL